MTSLRVNNSIYQEKKNCQMEVGEKVYEGSQISQGSLLLMNKPKNYSGTSKNFHKEYSEAMLKNQEIKKSLAIKSNNDAKFKTTFNSFNTGNESKFLTSKLSFGLISNNNTNYDKKFVLANLMKESKDDSFKVHNIKIDKLFRNASKMSKLDQNTKVTDLNLGKIDGISFKKQSDNQLEFRTNYKRFNQMRSKSLLLSNISKKLGISTEPKIISNPEVENSSQNTQSMNFERTSYLNFNFNDSNNEHMKKRDNFQKNIEIYTNENYVNFLKIPSRKNPEPPKTKNELAYRDLNIKLFNEARKSISMFLGNKYESLIEHRIGGDFIYIYKYLQNAQEFPIEKLHKRFLFYAFLSTIMHESLEKLWKDINFLYSKTFTIFLKKLIEYLKNLRKKHTYQYLQEYFEKYNSKEKHSKELCIHEFLYKYFCFFGRVDLEHIYANVIMQSFAIEDEAVRHEQYFNVNKTMYMILSKKFDLTSKVGLLKKLLSLLLPSNNFYIEEVLNFQKYFELDKLTLLTITQVDFLKIDKLKPERVLKIELFFDNIIKYIKECTTIE